MSSPRLVVLGNSLTALAVVRDAADAGLNPILVDNQPDVAQRTRRAQVVRFEEGASDYDVLDAILALADEGPMSLIATSDRWVRFIMNNRLVVGQAFERVLHPRNEALEICSDKALFLHWCRERGFPVPVSWFPILEDRPEELTLPVIIRPTTTRHGDAAKVIPKAIEVRTEEDLERWLDTYRDHGVEAVVSQSLLGRKLEQISIPIARTPEALLSFVARKVRPLPDRCAVGSMVELWPDENLDTLACWIAEAIDFYGIGELEVLRDTETGESWVIELNPRPWLQYALAPAAGYDFLNLVMGRPLRNLGQQRRKGRTWIEFRGDLFNAFSRSIGSVRSGEQSMGSYLSSLWRANVNARFSWKDLPASF